MSNKHQALARIITMPIFLSPVDYQRYTVADTVDKANRRWPFVQHHLSPPLDWADWLGLVENLTGLEDLSGLEKKETAIILVGHGEDDPNINSDIAKLSRLFYEAHDFGWVDVAFVNNVTPTVGDLITRYQTLGAKQIRIVPYLLSPGHAHQQ